MAPPQISVSNDIESNTKHDTKSHIGFSSSPVSSQLSTDPTEKIRLSRSGVLGKLQQLEEWLDKKMGIETQGIERIHEENKIPPSMFNMFLIWWSLIIHVGSLPIGVLGPQLGLSLPQCTIAIVLGSVFGGLVTGFCASLGPKLGLRAIATARYSFGFYGAKICSFMNIVGCVGFGTVNVVVAGQLISAVSGYKLTLSVGCIIIGVLSYFVSLFGFKIIHTYEKYSWIASLIILCILTGQIWTKVDPSLSPTSTGIANKGAFLSFSAFNFAACSSWGAIAADYYCNYTSDTPKWKIYTLTTAGISIPSAFIAFLGACLSNIAHNIIPKIDPEASSYAHPELAEAFKLHGLGGILNASYHPAGLSKLCVTFLAFSVVGNNVAVIYSCGLCTQLLGHFFQPVPRLFWSFLTVSAITLCAVIGRENLSTIVSNLIGLLGYWSVSYAIIIILEDKVFRRRSGYNLEVWNSPSGCPWGIAAMVTIIVSYLAGGVTGMAQSIYIGPIAQKFGSQGADVGIPLSGLLTLILYPVTRQLEMKYNGK